MIMPILYSHKAECPKTPERDEYALVRHALRYTIYIPMYDKNIYPVKFLEYDKHHQLV